MVLCLIIYNAKIGRIIESITINNLFLRKIKKVPLIRGGYNAGIKKKKIFCISLDFSYLCRTKLRQTMNMTIKHHTPVSMAGESWISKSICIFAG